MKQKLSQNEAPIPFTTLLLDWNRTQNTREMPWKGEKDPYRIWLSEIILQQTRVDQGLAYYERFIVQYPSIKALASAPDDEVFKLWEGLGYYSRCRNLLHTARIIATKFNGEFPSTYDAIKELKGVGPYTAAAISSFAFNLPHAVVDGNVFRVLARIFGVHTPTDSTEGKKYFTALAEELLDKKNPGIFNQAIMDFGAVVCKPAVPLCGECVFNASCYAFNQQEIQQLPVKEKKIKIKRRWFYYLVTEYKGKWLIRQRTAKDIWQQLYEFPLVEMEKEEETEVVLNAATRSYSFIKAGYDIVSVSRLFKQQLSHQFISGRFIVIKLNKKPEGYDQGVWVDANEKEAYAFPKFVNDFFSTWKVHLPGGRLAI